jgi:hypothetical protein
VEEKEIHKESHVKRERERERERERKKTDRCDTRTFYFERTLGNCKREMRA